MAVTLLFNCSGNLQLHEINNLINSNLGCKSRLSVAEIAMAIWFQVSGVRFQAPMPLFIIPDT